VQYFFDTSALVKYYHPELGTPVVASILATPGRKVRISSLGLVELQSAFAIKVRSGALSRVSADQHRLRLLHDIASGSIEVYGVTPQHFSTAEILISRYSYSFRLRALDAIQLAVGLDLAARNLVDQFVVADSALAEVARLESLLVCNPEAGLDL
jgi:uncharacterized protein